MIDPKILTFLTAAEQKSFTKAAKVLSLTQPAVSHHISQLEAELNAPLFLRGRHELTLTREGERLLPKIRQAVEAFEQVEQEALALQRCQNTVRLGFVYGAQRLLDERLSAFCAAHPEVSVESSFISNEALPRALKSGQLDLCCCGGQLENFESIHYPILCEPIVFGVSVQSGHGFFQLAQTAAEFLTHHFQLRFEMIRDETGAVRHESQFLYVQLVLDDIRISLVQGALA